MPFLPIQFATFQRLKCNWRWHIVEGAAANTGSTKWCKPQLPRLSKDGSTAFINSIRSHPRVRVYQQQWWEGGKDQMCNEALKAIKEPCWLMQIDVDEIYTPEQLDRLVNLFNGPIGGFHNCAQFYCRYFLGPNIVTVGENSYGNRVGEWTRLFKFEPGMKFLSHEPPVMQGINDTGETNKGDPIPNEMLLTRRETAAFGLVFDHYAYVFPQQVMFKEKFYGYEGALEMWYRLQRNTVWPTRLRQWLSWTDDKAQADLLYKE